MNWTVPSSTDASYVKAVQDAVLGYLKSGSPMDQFEGFKILNPFPTSRRNTAGRGREYGSCLQVHSSMDQKLRDRS